jgi:multicomponent Na+:H+ antiporter subunit B
MVLLTLLAVITFGVIRVRNLFAVVVLFGAYSFLMASVMLVLDAPDVALTEAAVGAGLSTVLMLSALYLTRTNERAPRNTPLLPAVVSIGTGAMLIYGTWGLPGFGLSDTPLNTHVGMEFITRTYPETHVPNVVTAVLASYRGYDTLGEVLVVFIAAIGVLMLMRRWPAEARTGSAQRKRGDDDAS